MAKPLETVVASSREEIKYASTTISRNARTIGVGLSLIVYTLVFAGDRSAFIAEHRIALVFAAGFGIACIVLDYLQYYCMMWENRSVLESLRREKAAIAALVEDDPDAAADRARQMIASLDTIHANTGWSWAREACFHLKFLVAMFGSVAVVYLIWSLVWPAP